MTPHRGGLRLCALATLQVAVALATVHHSPTSRAATYSFVNIADTMTAGPTGVISRLGAPAISGERVAFFARYSGSSSQSGIYVGSGGAFTTIIEGDDSLPGSTSTGTTVGEKVTISGENVAFRAQAARVDGIFIGAGGPLSVVARNGDPAPFGTFQSFDDQWAPVIDGNAVAFRAGTTLLPQSIYRTSGGVSTRIAYPDMPKPGGGILAGTPGAFDMSGGKVAFGIAPSGIFVSDGSSVIKIAQSGDSASGETLSSVLFPAIHGDTVAFLGTYFWDGVFVGDGGALTTIAKHGDPSPTGTFTFFGGLTDSVDFDGSVVAFTAGDGAGAGVYASTAGVITSVLEAGDTLFGSTVLEARIGRHGLDSAGSGRMALSYILADGRRGIAMAVPVPEPSSAAVILLATTWAGNWTRRACRNSKCGGWHWRRTLRATGVSPVPIGHRGRHHIQP